MFRTLKTYVCTLRHYEWSKRCEDYVDLQIITIKKERLIAQQVPRSKNKKPPLSWD